MKLNQKDSLNVDLFLIESSPGNLDVGLVYVGESLKFLIKKLIDFIITIEQLNLHDQFYFLK